MATRCSVIVKCSRENIICLKLVTLIIYLENAFLYLFVLNASTFNRHILAENNLSILPFTGISFSVSVSQNRYFSSEVITSVTVSAALPFHCLQRFLYSSHRANRMINSTHDLSNSVHKISFNSFLYTLCPFYLIAICHDRWTMLFNAFYTQFVLPRFNKSVGPTSSWPLDWPTHKHLFFSFPVPMQQIVIGRERWSSEAGRVTAGLAES